MNVEMSSLMVAVAFLLSGCDQATPTSDQQQRAAQEQLSQESNAEVGMPSIVNFQEKRNLKMIYELRDTAIATVSYTQDMNGKLHKLCDSIGYGIPASTEFTNPQRVVGDSYHALATLPQADPNGLFSPSDAEGTWVLCLNPGTQKMSPVYVEPRVIVSPFALAP